MFPLKKGFKKATAAIKDNFTANPSKRRLSMPLAFVRSHEKSANKLVDMYDEYVVDGYPSERELSDDKYVIGIDFSLPINASSKGRNDMKDARSPAEEDFWRMADEEVERDRIVENTRGPYSTYDVHADVPNSRPKRGSDSGMRKSKAQVKSGEDHKDDEHVLFDAHWADDPLDIPVPVIELDPEGLAEQFARLNDPESFLRPAALELDDTESESGYEKRPSDNRFATPKIVSTPYREDGHLMSQLSAHLDDTTIKSDLLEICEDRNGLSKSMWPWADKECSNACDVEGWTLEFRKYMILRYDPIAQMSCGQVLPPKSVPHAIHVKVYNAGHSYEQNRVSKLLLRRIEQYEHKQDNEGLYRREDEDEPALPPLGKEVELPLFENDFDGTDDPCVAEHLVGIDLAGLPWQDDYPNDASRSSPHVIHDKSAVGVNECSQGDPADKDKPTQPLLRITTQFVGIQGPDTESPLDLDSATFSGRRDFVLPLTQRRQDILDDEVSPSSLDTQDLVRGGIFSGEVWRVDPNMYLVLPHHLFGMLETSDVDGSESSSGDECVNIPNIVISPAEGNAQHPLNTPVVFGEHIDGNYLRARHNSSLEWSNSF